MYGQSGFPNVKRESSLLTVFAASSDRVWSLLMDNASNRVAVCPNDWHFWPIVVVGSFPHEQTMETVQTDNCSLLLHSSGSLVSGG